MEKEYTLSAKEKKNKEENIWTLDKIRAWVAVDEAFRSNNNQQGLLGLYNETVDTSCLV